MTKNYALVTFAFLMLALLGLVWLHTGSIVPPSGQDAIWFNGGLLLLLLGKFITEYRFTKPNDVFLNCVATFVGISTLTNPPHLGWWEALRWGSAALAVIAVALSWDPGADTRREEHRGRAFLYRLVTTLGRADILFSIVFVLALISFFTLDTTQTKAFVIAWGMMLLASNLNVPSLTRTLRAGKGYPAREILGTLHSFLAPSIVYCTQVGERKPRLNELVGFAQSGSGPCQCTGIVIGERAGANETRIAVALLGCTITDTTLNDRSLMVSVSEQERAACNPPIDAQAMQRLSKIVGTVAKGTTIAQVKFELFGTPELTAGSMLRVGQDDKPVFYQVIDGVINEERVIKESSRAFIEGEAEQIGRWSQERGGFETHDWVSRERAPVYLIDTETTGPEYALAASEMQLGTVPQSNYPVNIDIDDFVLYHSAILGVTGSGKSFVTYAIAENCREKGIKSVCIDPTGDYQRYLADAVLVSTTNELNAFLASPEHHIAIIETAQSSKSPIEQTNMAANVCATWARQTRPDEHILDPKPRLLLILEEAHLLVPEWNFNPQQQLQGIVNQTAQIALQARKFGLGFLVVSQRTANVTKSILNQCNTIISFQAFDETGFDFLRNYMGPFHVRALPNLKPRHGILVGKSSRSRRPLMVHFANQDRQLRLEIAPAMPVPVKEESADNGETQQSAPSPNVV